MTPSKSAESEWAILKHELEAKGGVDTAPWTVSESATYRGFFMHGWEKALRDREGRDEMNMNEKALAALKELVHYMNHGEVEARSRGRCRTDIMDQAKEAITALESHPVAGQMSGDASGSQLVQMGWCCSAGLIDSQETVDGLIADGYTVEPVYRVIPGTIQQPQAPAVEVIFDAMREFFLNAEIERLLTNDYQAALDIRSALLTSRQGDR